MGATGLAKKFSHYDAAFKLSGGALSVTFRAPPPAQMMTKGECVGAPRAELSEHNRLNAEKIVRPPTCQRQSLRPYVEIEDWG